MPKRAPQQSHSSKVSIVYVGYLAISLSRIATGLFRSFVMSSSAGVEDSLAQVQGRWAQRIMGRGRDRSRRLTHFIAKRSGRACGIPGRAVHNFSKSLDGELLIRGGVKVAGG